MLSTDVVKVRLRDVMPDFVVSTSEIRCVCVRGFLREVVDAFKILKVRFSLEYLSGVTRKRLYSDMIDVCLPVPIYRQVYPVGTGENVLKRVKRMPIRSSVKTFFFMLHSGTLPVKPWLQEKGLYVHPWTLDCRLCKKPETIEHIFLDCWDAVFHWDILQRTLKKELPLTPYGIRYLPVVNNDGVPYDMFMALSLHAMWKTRMAVENADKDARTTIEYFIESVAYIREVYKTKPEQPEWLPMLDVLARFKKF